MLDMLSIAIYHVVVIFHEHTYNQTICEYDFLIIYMPNYIITWHAGYEHRVMLLMNQLQYQILHHMHHNLNLMPLQFG